MNEFINIQATEMQFVFQSVLLKQNFSIEKAKSCAEIFTTNSLEGVYTHGVNRFPRFVDYIKRGLVIPAANPTRLRSCNGLEQWNGNLGAGPLNAVHATERAMQLASQHAIGCVALSNTNHWMRGGYYGWQAARKGFVFIGWTNTIANMPAWNGIDKKLGNNPLVMAIPFRDEAIVLDMAMSQFSFGSMELAAMKNEKLPVFGGYDVNGNLTDDPAEIMTSERPLPIGYWKGAGLSLVLDILASILSAGLSTSEITKKDAEHALSQVFIAIDTRKLANFSSINAVIQNIIDDYKRAVAEEHKKITYPGERVLQAKQKNSVEGIPVLKTIWQQILEL